MNRICKILCAVLLARLLLSFGWAIVAKDPENGVKPRLTVSGLLDGSYYSSLAQNYRDDYPNQEYILEDFEWLNRVYGIRDEK
jgi:hypothetical protein